MQLRRQRGFDSTPRRRCVRLRASPADRAFNTQLGACLDNSGLWWWCLLKLFMLVISKTFWPWTIDQPLLLPPSVQDFVGEDHLARFILALVLEHLDLGRSKLRTRASGAAAV